MHATLPLLKQTTFPPLRRRALQTLQVNLGYICNQSCQHCHVNASPQRTETMSAEIIDTVIEVLRAREIKTLDLTGGAPELNIHFRRLVVAARALGIKVIDRCNLTILFEPGQETLAEFLTEQKVTIVASLPCYSLKNVDEQRGKGTFEKSIKALQQLNALGYGKGSGLELSLVYNPLGPSLPPSQSKLEADYKHLLGEQFGIVFDHLYTLANMPIQRFGSMLVSKGTFAGYMKLLRDNHKDENLDAVMCRDTVSVDYNGALYDCDFNQMLGLPAAVPAALAAKKARLHVGDLLATDLDQQPIRIADHCYGCTAGQGSSCGGALA
jgi:radical SAM/Cys-rich protein